MLQKTLVVEIHTRPRDAANDPNLVDGLVDQLARAACDIANSNAEGVHLVVRDSPAVDRIRYNQLAQCLADLLDWERHLGGWDAECWKRAKQLHRKVRKR